MDTIAEAVLDDFQRELWKLWKEYGSVYKVTEMMGLHHSKRRTVARRIHEMKQIVRESYERQAEGPTRFQIAVSRYTFLNGNIAGNPTAEQGCKRA